MATETQENEASSLGDEWQWINNETAEVLRATVENAFFADPRKNWSAEELARWIRDVGLVSAKKNVWDHAAALGEFLVNGLGYVTGEDYMSMDLALMFTIAEDEAVAQMMNDASLRTVHRYMVGINCWSAATGQPVSTAPAGGAATAASGISNLREDSDGAGAPESRRGSDSQAADMEELNGAKREASQSAHQELCRREKINMEHRQTG